MLAARDQENLVHGHQTAAAAKPLNQGAKQLPPKTPGRTQLAPKTPFRVPLNDENGGLIQGGGRTGLKTNGKGNENYTLRGKKTGGLEKNAFMTPSAGESNAPTLALINVLTEAARFSSPLGCQNRQCQNQSLSNPGSDSKRQCRQRQCAQGCSICS